MNNFFSLYPLIGFEAEAQRYAMLARRRKEREDQAAAAAAGDTVAQAIINQDNADEIEHDNWSYSSDDYRCADEHNNIDFSFWSLFCSFNATVPTHRFFCI
jgi:hypothetical protein